MIKEFREFIERGNVIDLAVAVVIGAAFAAIVASFSKDILMPIIGIFGGKPSFDEYTLTINNSVISWGTFLTAVVSFLIVAFAVFLLVKAINKMQNMRPPRRSSTRPSSPRSTSSSRSAISSWPSATVRRRPDRPARRHPWSASPPPAASSRRSTAVHGSRRPARTSARVSSNAAPAAVVVARSSNRAAMR